MVDAYEVHEKEVAATRTLYVDCTDQLATGETISTLGTPAVSPSGLTVDTETIGSGTRAFPNRTAADGQWFSVKAAGGTDGTCYGITVQVTTNSTNSDTFPAELKLQVT